MHVEESFWEDVAVMQEVFTHFNLEDQVCFDDGRNVTDLTRKGMQKEVEAESEITTEGVTERVRRKSRWMKEYQM